MLITKEVIMSYIKVPKILLPQNIDMSKWAIIACDQFTARPKYWTELEKYIGDSPSTYKVVFPEIYLNKVDQEERISSINKEMKRYIDAGLFQEINNFVLVEREVENGKKRIGLMICIDLDAYDWHRVRVPIRATEDTLTERLPVRIKIREKANLESPHAIALIDNPERDIIEPLYGQRNKFKKLYDFDLNMGGGNIKGYEVPQSEKIIPKILSLLNQNEQVKKYGIDAGVLMVIGDGNHSVATAKVTWENIKATLSETERENHPSRYMLVEMINIYSGVDFKPIHRIVYNPSSDFLSGLSKELNGESNVKIVFSDHEDEIKAPDIASYTIMGVQKYIEKYLKENPQSEVDYIHNEGHLKEAVAESGGNTIGIVMPSFPREELVNFVVNVGNLPKKAFSIGEPQHKRYYLEMRKISN
jgi:hypothetical protein